MPNSSTAHELDPYILRTMDYADYLQTDHWQVLRQTMLERAGHCCQRCGSTVALQVHHKTYDNRGNEDYHDLIVLCRHCHEREHHI